MGAKKEMKASLDSMRAEIQSLADAFWGFKESMVTDIAVRQAEQQSIVAIPAEPASWSAPDDATVESTAAMMAALGHPQRLRIAMLLAKSPVSVNDLVQQLGLNTSGSAYHHLNVLVNAGIATQPQRGSFEMTPEALVPVSAALTSFFGEDVSPADEEPTEQKSGGKKKK